MSDFSITCSDFDEGAEIPKKFGYKFENEEPNISFNRPPSSTTTLALIMDDPDAMGAVGKVWLHWLQYHNLTESSPVEGKTDFDEIGYGGPAPPDGRHTYVFKAYALDTELELKEGFSKQELEDAMKGHIIAEAKLTGTFAP
ncbi:phospholipid-binding protein [Candidatus Nitrosopelagicus brevis]|uniref:Phospholipid-binding protein n=1 Tax=Candidatus Nitrosopelagicus brevis TaxID=1410606 RepID=A0A0A7UZL3_9ARCH|nr:YbhB/YbcL family Raf kinase inhibitor-like protein [Candidatus Nitrosopelagicus brevis]AJA92202.1 Raf-like protein [Candidatus Nitrosopelagicus brevis]PTL87220.1 phospholipid-binding protein [Candidatus Nitrosopelagicus brevis]